MKQDQWPLRIRVVLVLLIVGGGCANAAKDPNVVLPGGMDILERSIQAVGGREALLKINSQVLKGTIEVEPLDINGVFEITQERPNKVHMKLKIAGMGTIEHGSDGQVYWERRSNGEIRLFEGEELDLHLLSAYFDETYYRQLYRHVEVMGIETVDATACYQVLLVPHRGPHLIVYYAKDSGLRLRTQLHTNRGGISVPMDTYARDYRETDVGITVAYTILEVSMGTETWRKLTDVKYNVKIDPNLFVAPKVTPKPSGD